MVSPFSPLDLSLAYNSPPFCSNIIAGKSVLISLRKFAPSSLENKKAATRNLISDSGPTIQIFTSRNIFKYS